ncbi:MAG: hypothetical protein LPK19_00950 [Hymenobacteraceae bacterium]|nr:hypothetical protein [Hymenobacteraceae bacterium]MDX5394737.1 hypothetical protein [Hymenobacteraceae bacterium]MDX5510770.1 hypothetical protein [Hymenobacteraceae bacterium]
MKKHWILLAFAGTFMFAACTEDRGTTTEVKDSDEGENPSLNPTADNTTTYTMDTAAAMDNQSDMEAMYRDRASRISGQMATDLSLDTATRSRVNTIYYNRSLRLGGLDKQYSADTTGRAVQMRTIQTETDQQLKSTLTPDQYKKYESRRMQYDEMKYKNGDTKIKMEGDEAKYKNGDTKMKMEGDETKYKSGDTKIKTETK